MPEKIPDYILLKEAQKEIGKLNAYVEELEDELKKYTTVTPEELKEIKKSIVYKQQKDKITELNRKISELRKDIEKFIMKQNQKQP